MSLLAEDTEKKPGKAGVKNDDEGQDTGGDGKKASKKGKKKANGTSPENLKGPLPTGAAAPNEEQKKMWAEKMRNGTPAERRDMINSIPDPAMRDVARQKLKDQGLQLAD
jgi:hypothetical protein